MGILKKVLVLLLLIPSLAWGALVADIETRPATTVEVGEEVYFSGTGTTYDDADLLLLARYEWDFGDGYYLRHDPSVSTVTRSGIAATHYYMAPGEYTVTLSTKVFAGTNSSGDPSSFLSAYSYGSTLGMGSTKTAVANGVFKYTINGTVYTLAADAVGTTPGNDVVPKDKYGAVAFDVGTDGAIHVIEAANNATGYSGWDAAVAGIATVAADHVRIGTVAVAGLSKAFTFGTTEFDDPGISTNIVPSSKQLIGTSVFSFQVGETIYTLPQNLIGYSMGDDVIPSGKYGAVALDVGTDLTVHTIEATDNATGYTTAALARAGLPAAAESHVRLGTVAVRKSDGDFTCGLTSLSLASVTKVFTPVESTPIATDTDTQVITVTGTAPIAGFEIQRANFNNRTKQYLYIQIPADYIDGGASEAKLTLSIIDTTADPDVTTVLINKKTNLAAEEIYLFDQTGLTASHDYVLQAQLLDADDEQITGGLWRDKFTTPSGTPTVSINENNTFVIGGSFFFPMGPFMKNASEMPTYKADAGVTVMHTEGYYATHTTTTFGSYLASAATNGLRVMGPGRGDYSTGAYPNRWQFNHNTDTMETYVTDNKTSAGLFSWLWQDEPNLGGRAQKTYPPVLGAWGYIVHSNDPNHPYGNAFYGSDWTGYISNPSVNDYDYLLSHQSFGGKKWIQDIISFDIYPVCMAYHAAINYSTTQGPYSVYLEAVDRFITNNKNLAPFIPTINPGTRQPTDYSYYGITHTADQVYLEGWMNVIHGAKGIIWFPFFVPSEIQWAAMKKFADQMAAYKHIVLLADSSTSITDNSNVILNRVDFIARDYDSATWIFAARVTEPDPLPDSSYLPGGSKYKGVEGSSITTTFTVDGLLATDTVTVKEEGRTISHSAGSFTDTFAKNAVHIYQITTDAPAADTTDPVVNAFSIPETYEALELPITTFQCSDAVGVTHYLINEVASEPAGNDANWATSAQTSYTFADRGAKTLYAWCKDAAGNISASKSDTTTLTTPNYNVAITVGTGCSVSPTTTQSIAQGATTSFTVEPQTGYAVSAVSGCGGTWSASPYETAAITEVCTVTTVCNAIQGDRIVSTSAGTGCTITPSAEQTVIDGSSLVYTVGRSTGYDLVSVTGCGGTLLGNEYTTGYITENCTIELTCSGHVATIGSGGTMTLGAGGSGGGSTCSPTTDKLGTTNVGGAPPSIAKDLVYCSPYTPSCYGSLQKAYVAHVGTSVSSGKVCVYSDDGDSIANSGDLKIGCSGDISSGSTEWAYSDMDGGTLASGSYWVCFAVKADAVSTFALDRSVTTVPLAYKTSSGFYASPPANLNGLTTTSGAGFSTYVTVGP